MRTSFVALALAGLTIASVSTDVSAQTRHRARSAARAPIIVAESNDLGGSIPLTVNRRSWLDSGNAVSSHGVGPSYVSANTVLNKTQDKIFAPDTFGNDVIQGPPYVPGRSQPVVEGSLLPNGQPVIDNVLLPQNFYLNPAPSVP